MPGTIGQRFGAACVVVAVIAAGLTAWRVFGPAEPAGFTQWRTQAHLSEDFNASMVTLVNTISVRKQLSDDDVSFVVSMMGGRVGQLPEPGGLGGLSPDEEEALIGVQFGYGIAGERLRFGGVSNESRARLAAHVVAGLDSNKPYERLLAIGQACYGKLVADEAVRLRIVELQSDANEIVRSQAVRQLAHYDKIAELERTGRRPKERPPAYWR